METSAGTDIRPTKPALHRLAERLGEVEALDGPARRVLALADRVIRPGRPRDVLSGTFLGHALHPLMTDVPIGSWTSAVFLDHFGGDRNEPAARRLIGLGILSSLPTAATGYVEWADSAGGRAGTRRIGLVHAATNVTALALFTASFLARKRGRGGRGLALAGSSALAVGGHLGGHLAYVHGEGVAVTAFEEGPTEWVAAVSEGELMPGTPICAMVDRVPILLVRDGDQILALANRCTHRGGPLHEGEIDGGHVTCPRHGSQFELSDGSVRRGPASSPQPAYETRVREGRVEVRQVTDPTP
jgi:nitrite reductase/ring-hydroxylating ferredoxin subunit